MRALLAIALAAGLLAAVHAGSGKDTWGNDTLVNFPPGQGRKELPVQANDEGAPPAIDLPCQCSDADPRDERTQDVMYPCFFQRVFQKCSEQYMFDANAELAPEGHCQVSCSRCSCCVPPADVAQQLGASRFLQALDAAQPSLKDALQHPGYTATLLVPTDAAWDAALAQHGALLQSPSFLQEVLKLHIVPPEPVRRGLWSSPLLTVGPKLYTLFDGPASLTVPKFDLPSDATWKGGLTGWRIQGPFNAATVLQSDVPACKSLLTVIDAVLLPFDSASPPPADALSTAALVGARGCGVQPNAVIAGQELKAGEQNRVATIGDCCASCAATPGCNAWSYCAFRGGCEMPLKSDAKPYGWCQLKRSDDIAAGNMPSFSDFSAVTVPLASGWTVGPPGINGAAPQPVVMAAGGQPGGGR